MVEICFEAGATITSVTDACELVRHANAAGAQSIKFQIILNPDDLFASGHRPTITYWDNAEKAEVTKPQIDVIRGRCLSRAEWKEVIQETRSHPLFFYGTGDSVEDVEFMAEEGVDGIKVGSSDVLHLPLLEEICKTGLHVLIDNGRHSLGELERCVDFVRERMPWPSAMTIVHCPSGYPTKEESIHLNMLKTLKLMFPDVEIGFSDHSPGYEMDVAALALGAQYIEKTVTLSRDQPGPEHVMSLEPHEMKPFVETLERVEFALGLHRRIITVEEKKARKATRRGVYTGNNFQTLFQRPENNMTPEEYWKETHEP